MSKWFAGKFLEGKNVPLAISETKIPFPKKPDTSIFSYDIRTQKILLGDKKVSLDSLYTLQGA